MNELLAARRRALRLKCERRTEEDHMVLACNGCGILISVSRIAGGNPTAEANPDQWATSWQTCGSCHAPFCDKCVKKRSGLFRGAKCDCGGALSEKYNVTP